MKTLLLAGNLRWLPEVTIIVTLLAIAALLFWLS
jgi:hypothetical protein